MQEMRAMTRRDFMRLGLGVAAAAVAGGSLVGLCACYPQKRRLASRLEVGGAAIGIVRTSYGRDRTRVYYLSPELEVMGSVRIDAPYLGSGGQDSRVAGSALVLVEDKSRKFLPSGDKVHCLDVLTQELTTYRTESPDVAAAFETHIFAAQNYVGEDGKAVTEISSLERAGGTAATQTLAGENTACMLWYDGSLWTVGIDDYWTREIAVHQFSEDLSLLSSTSIELPTEFDEDAERFTPVNLCAHEGALHLTTNAVREYAELVPWSRICRIDCATQELNWLEMGKRTKRTQTLCFADGCFYALQGDALRDLSGPAWVCAYDGEGRLIAQSEDLNTNPRQMVLVGDCVFVNGQDEVFALDAKTLELLARATPDAQGECEDNVGLFAMPV